MLGGGGGARTDGPDMSTAVQSTWQHNDETGCARRADS